MSCSPPRPDSGRNTVGRFKSYEPKTLNPTTRNIQNERFLYRSCRRDNRHYRGNHYISGCIWCSKREGYIEMTDTQKLNGSRVAWDRHAKAQYQRISKRGDLAYERLVEKDKDYYRALAQSFAIDFPKITKKAYVMGASYGR